MGANVMCEKRLFTSVLMTTLKTKNRIISNGKRIPLRKHLTHVLFAVLDTISRSSSLRSQIVSSLNANQMIDKLQEDFQADFVVLFSIGCEKYILVETLHAQ